VVSGLDESLGERDPTASDDTSRDDREDLRGPDGATNGSVSASGLLGLGRGSGRPSGGRLDRLGGARRRRKDRLGGTWT
jgi:hypothetical protein